MLKQSKVNSMNKGKGDNERWGKASCSGHQVGVLFSVSVTLTLIQQVLYIHKHLSDFFSIK